MGLKKYWEQFMENVSGPADDDGFETDEYEDEDTTEEEERRTRRQPVPARRPAEPTYAAPQPLKMMIVEPESFEDAQRIADYLRDRKPVVINFESTVAETTKRIVDFVSGATYALDGNIQKVGKDIFLCTPSNVTVDKGKQQQDYSEFSTPPLQWNSGDVTGSAAQPPKQ